MELFITHITTITDSIQTRKGEVMYQSERNALTVRDSRGGESYLNIETPGVSGGLSTFPQLVSKSFWAGYTARQFVEGVSTLLRSTHNPVYRFETTVDDIDQSTVIVHLLASLR